MNEVDATLNELFVVDEVARRTSVELGGFEHAHVEVGVVEPLDGLADVSKNKKTICTQSDWQGKVVPQNKSYKDT